MLFFGMTENTFRSVDAPGPVRTASQCAGRERAGYIAHLPSYGRVTEMQKRVTQERELSLKALPASGHFYRLTAGPLPSISPFGSAEHKLLWARA